MVSGLDLSRILTAGADSLDRSEACMRCGADPGGPCTGSGGSEFIVTCPDRPSANPQVAAALRAMAEEAHQQYQQLL